MGFQAIKLELGHYYMVKGHVCEFIKSTPKGYNFKYFITGRKVYKRHIYPSKYHGKGYFIVPQNVMIRYTQNPFENPELMKKFEEFRKEHITSEIRKEINIVVDKEGNIIN